MHEQYNGGGVETVLSDEEQALKSLAWQKGYTLGVTEGYDSLEDSTSYTGQEAVD